MEIFKTLRTFFRVALGVIITYYTYQSLIHLSDNNLIKLNIIAKLFLEISGSAKISWTLTGVAFILFLRYKRLMKKKVEVLAPYKDLVEKSQWKQKTSSNINKDGTTRKEDKI